MSAQSEHSAGDAAPHSARRILVVGSRRDTAEHLSRMLSGLGHDVWVVSTLAGAVRICQESQFDLILSDLVLPDGRATELAPVVKRNHPGAKLVALADDGMRLDQYRAALAGFDGHVSKPITLERLFNYLG